VSAAEKKPEGDDANIGKQALDIAKAADVSVDVVKKAAAFIDGIFGNSISNSMGLIADKLAYYRLGKAIELQERVEKKLQALGVERRYVPVAFGLPIIEKATIEDNSVLQDKWANLLTNARNASYDKPLRRNYSSMLADMEPLDTLVLDTVAREYLQVPNDKQKEALFDKDLLIKDLNLSENDGENAVRNLMRLGLFKPGNITGGASIGDHPLSSYKDTEIFGITAMGVDFYHAVNEPTHK
jgi:hypothetical protein